jgi:pimeloyl-CoA synthetase
LTKYFFTLFEESGKPIFLKVDIQYMKDFINVVEVLKSEDVDFSKVNIEELQFVTCPLS